MTNKKLKIIYFNNYTVLRFCKKFKCDFYEQFLQKKNDNSGNEHIQGWLLNTLWVTRYIHVVTGGQ